MAVGGAGGVGHHVHAGGDRKTPGQPGHRIGGHLRRDRIADGHGHLAGHPVEVGVQPGHQRPALGNPGRQFAAEGVHAGSGGGGGGQHPHSHQPVLGQQPGQVFLRGSPVGLGQQIDLVERHQGDPGMSGEAPQVALVEGGIGIFLWVDDPDERVDHLDQSIDLGPMRLGGGIVVGQVDQHQACQLVGGIAHNVSARNLQPVEKPFGPTAHDGGPGLRRGGTTYPDRCQVFTEDGIERRRLAAAGGARKRHHGVGGAMTEAPTGRLECLSGMCGCVVVQALRGQIHHA